MISNGYPFTSKREVLERIDADPAFALECMTILQARHEQRKTAGGKSMGWMASDAKRGAALAAKLAAGEATEKERAEAVQLLRHYGKQLAKVFRERELDARPELVAQAAVFGVGPEGMGVEPPAAGGTSAEAQDAVPPTAKKRGRPKGSKNKPKESGMAAGRRRRS